jgi:hypothetical protein
LALTPAAIAQWCGPKTAKAYEKALRRHGYGIEVDEDGDVFWEIGE